MALAQIQTVLAKIYTDAEFRQRFFCNPYDVAIASHLEESDIERMIELSRDELESFAVSLIYKRLGETRKKLFFTSKFLGKKFARLFFQYAENSSMQGAKKHLNDCLLFAGYIDRMAVKEEVAPWILEVMRYEVNEIKSLLFTNYVSIMIFHYDITALVDGFLKNQTIQPIKKIRIGVWGKLFSSRKFFRRVF